MTLSKSVAVRAAAGTYVLAAQATDAGGATTTGAPRTVHRS